MDDNFTYESIRTIKEAIERKTSDNPYFANNKSVFFKTFKRYSEAVGSMFDKTTKIDPVGFKTLSISFVATTKELMYCFMVFSDPICFCESPPYLSKSAL